MDTSFSGGWVERHGDGTYGIDLIPQICLIGPDGRILARDLRGPRIRDALTLALSRNSQGVKARTQPDGAR